MRITHNTITRNYLKNLNRNMSNLSTSNERMTSQRRFNKASENVADANRALTIRLQLSRNETNLSSARDLGGSLSIVEDNMQAITQITQNVTDRLIQGMNGTMSPEERAKIANEIKSLQGEVLQIGNAQYNGTYIFGADGNAKGTAPYTLGGADGKQLLFNGTAVDDMVAGTGDNLGKVVTMQEVPAGSGTFKEVVIPYNGKNYVDIGLGFDVNSDGVLDPKTAVQSSVSGVEVFGFGKTADGTPKNLYGLLGKMVDNLEAGDIGALGKNLEELSTQTDHLLMNLADIGTRQKFIEQTSERIENDTLSLQKIQNDVEAVPIQEESIYNKDYEMSWMVTLQMGSKILPVSIFDFMR